MRSLMLFVMLTAAVTAVPCTAFAQQGPPGQSDDMVAPDSGPGRGNALSEERREEIRRKIETIRIWRLTEQLKLDTATSAKLASLLSSFDQQRKSIMEEQMRTMRDLRSYLRVQKPDEAKLGPAIDKLEKNQLAMQDLRRKEIEGLKGVLTIEQQARYILFQQEFQREMRDMITGARGGPMGGHMGRRSLNEGPDAPPKDR